MIIGKFQKWVSYGLIGLSLYYVPQAVITVANEGTLGSVVRNFAVPIVLLIVSGLLQTTYLPRFGLTRPSFPEFSGYNVIVFILFSVSTALAGMKILGEVLSYGGMLTVLVALISIIGVAVMFFLVFIGSETKGLAILIFLQSFWNSYLLYWDIHWVFWPFLGGVLCRMFLERRLPVRTSIDGILFPFFLIFLLSSLASKDTVVSLSGFIHYIVIPAIWFFLIVNQIRSREDLVLLIMALAVSGVVALGIRWYFWLHAEMWNPLGGLRDEYVSLTGTGGWMAARAAYSLPFVIGCILFDRGLGRKVGWLTAIFFLAYLMLLSGTRSALIAGAMSSLLVLFHTRSARRAYLVMIGVFVLAVVSISTLNLLVFERFGMWNSISNVLIDQAQRLDGWNSAIQMTIEHPWLGIGLEMWPEYNYLYFLKFILTHAHNTFLNYASAGGVGAFISVLVLIGLVMWKGMRLWQSSADSYIRGISLAGLSAVVVEVINGAIGGAWYLGQSFWIGMGILMVIERIKYSTSSESILKA